MNRFLTLVLAFALLLSACGAGAAGVETAPTPYPTPIKETFTVQRGDIVIEAKLSGRVTPLALYTVYFEMNGQVGESFVNVNDVVTEGQLLGELVEAREIKAKAQEMQNVIRRAQIDLEIAQLTLEQYRTQGRSQAEIQIQKLQVELAQMNLDETLLSMGIDPETYEPDDVDSQIAMARAYAPANGTIIAAVSAGRKLNSSTAAYVLGDPDKLEVVVQLDESKGDDEVREMFEGMPVIITLDANPNNPLTGKIRQLPSPYGTGDSEDRSVHILLDAAPSATTYQNGDKVTAVIQLASKSDVLWLPPDAIRTAGGRTFVIINSEAGPKRVDVELGLQTRDMVEIISGLDEGQVVVSP
jgi:multidrug efflux pump subunit AcrA (membrane-fusion protein)